MRRLAWRELRGALGNNLGLKLVSLALAFAVWFWVNAGERDAERQVTARVLVRSVPAGLMVTNPRPRQVGLTLRGPRTILDTIRMGRLRLPLDLAGVRPGFISFRIGSDMVRPPLPRRVKVVRVNPSQVNLHVERKERRRLPVRVALAGKPPLGYRIARKSVEPATVEVTGPAGRLRELKEVETEPVDVRGLQADVEREVRLLPPGEFVSYVPDRVVVRLGVEEIVVSREFRHVTVEVRGAAGPASLRPPWVNLKLRGPERLLAGYRPDGKVYVDASGMPAGVHEVSVRVDVASGIEVVDLSPQPHRLTIGSSGTSRRGRRTQ